MKFLIDEYFSEELAKLARAYGHLQSSHLRWIGKGQVEDGVSGAPFQQKDLCCCLEEEIRTFAFDMRKLFSQIEQSILRFARDAGTGSNTGLVCLKID